MRRLEVSGAVRPMYGSLGVKRLNKYGTVQPAYIETARDLFFPMQAGAV